ncbi:MAG: amino acid transporter [Pseudomonadota bacterium]
MTREIDKPWRPLSVERVAALFEDASFPWWIAGGLAIDLAVGASTRAHADTDVLILRVDQRVLRTQLEPWEFWAADPPGTLRRWLADDTLAPGVHDVWCRASATDDWRLQIMLDESTQGRWVSRRDERVSLPLDSITRVTDAGISYLAPHVQLYYKAKNVRQKDQLDFDALLQRRAEVDWEWLGWAIATTYGAGHRWRRSLPR